MPFSLQHSEFSFNANLFHRIPIITIFYCEQIFCFQRVQKVPVFHLSLDHFWEGWPDATVSMRLLMNTNRRGGTCGY